MISRSNTDASTSSTATGISTLSQSTLLTNVTSIAPISAVAPTTGIKGAISRYSTARKHRKAQKAASKAAHKSENRARSRAYFADFYADDKVGAWHNAPATGFRPRACNDDPLGGSDVEDLVPVAELIKDQTQVDPVMNVSRIVDGRPVMIEF